MTNVVYKTNFLLEHLAHLGEYKIHDQGADFEVKGGGRFAAPQLEMNGAAAGVEHPQAWGMDPDLITPAN